MSERLAMSSSARKHRHSVMPEPCILCGCLLLYSMEKRYKNLQDLAWLLQCMCVPTPYVYQHVIRTAAAAANAADTATTKKQRSTSSACCCIACINWIRRLDMASITTGAKMRRGCAKEGQSCMTKEGSGDAAATAPLMLPNYITGVMSALLVDEQLNGNDNDWSGDGMDCDDYDSCCDDCVEDADEADNTPGSAVSSSPSYEEWLLAQLDAEEDEVDKHGTESPAEEQQKERLCTSCAVGTRHHAHCQRHHRVSRNLMVVPLDNLLLFLDNPGMVGTGGMHPDRRCMYRLMCGLVMTHSVATSLEKKHETRNPYLMFCSPVTERMLRMFRRKYAPQGANCSVESRHHACGTPVAQQHTPHFAVIDGAESIAMVNDVVKCWWESVGMPSVLQSRGAACMVRRALRIGDIADTMGCI